MRSVSGRRYWECSRRKSSSVERLLFLRLGLLLAQVLAPFDGFGKSLLEVHGASQRLQASGFRHRQAAMDG